MIIVQILVAVALFVLIGGLLAPIESLSWWAKSGPQSLREIHQLRSTHPYPSARTEASECDSFVVYVSGIGVIDRNYMPPVELPMIQTLIDRLGRTRFITDVYPYSPGNIGLVNRRRTGRIWRRLASLKGTRGSGIAFLINIRNAWQMIVSLDRRYGPVYNSGVALAIMKSLIKNGYDIAHPKPVVLLGWSGGGQIALGSSWYLSALGVPCYVLSVAGILSSDPALERVEHLWHLEGSRDVVMKAMRFCFPAKWRIFLNSAWNRAVRAGKITQIAIGEAAHQGKNGYFAGATPTDEGKTPFGMTAEAIISTLVTNGFSVDDGTPDVGATPPVVTKLTAKRSRKPQ